MVWVSIGITLLDTQKKRNVSYNHPPYLILMGAYMTVSYKPIYRGIIFPLTATYCKQVFIFLESNAGVFELSDDRTFTSQVYF